MAFRHLIHDATFDPETLEIMSAAYNGVCKNLNLADRDDPLTALVAKKIIELASRGERGADLMYHETLRAFGGSADSP
jgi:hypothetical protein